MKRCIGGVADNKIIQDVLLSNDFGGEAFFPLKDVPGIINPKGKTSVGNFHGLKQVELVLIFQENTGKS